MQHGGSPARLGDRLSAGLPGLPPPALARSPGPARLALARFSGLPPANLAGLGLAQDTLGQGSGV